MSSSSSFEASHLYDWIAILMISTCFALRIFRHLWICTSAWFLAFPQTPNSTPVCPILGVLSLIVGGWCRDLWADIKLPIISTHLQWGSYLLELPGEPLKEQLYLNDFSGSFPLAQQTVIPFYQHYVHDLKYAGKSHFKAVVLSHLLNASCRGSGQRSFLVSFTTFPLVTVSMTHM